MSGAEAAERLRRREAWLALDDEPALEPDLAIIDPHHHLWNRGGHRYLPPEYADDAAGLALGASVYVECLNEYRSDGPPELQSVGETEFAARAATAGPPAVCAGIVAWADLAAPGSLPAALAAHTAAAAGRLRGLRYATAFDASPEVHGAYPTRAGMLGEDAVRAGARVLAARGLTLDLWAYFHQLGEVAEFAAAVPELTIVVDHCGGPIGVGPYAGRRDEVFAHWRRELTALARHDNVRLKFGGLAMPLAGFGFRDRERPPHSDDLVAAWAGYFEVCLEAFGAARMMFESNFPVDRTGCSYRTLWNAFKKLSARLSSAERHALLAGTASEVYRLAP